MRILILTDSLSLPREYSGGQVCWEDIYVNLLRNSMPDIEFVHVGIGGATITELLRLQHYYALTKPDIVVLQCGIVDCAPRALGEIEVKIINKMRLYPVVKPFVGFLRKYRGLRYTSPRVFEKNLLALKARFLNTPFISLGILPGCTEYDEIAPGVSKSIERYNQILENHTDFIDNSNFPREAIIDDYHHMNAKGHSIVFSKLKSKIEAIVGS